jgi:hypothetical protein
MAKKTPLTDEVAKELGYKDAKELKAAIAERKKGSLKDRLESGQGFGEAITGSFAQKTTDIKETFSKKGAQKLGRRAYRSFFSGDDIFSAYMRGRLNKKGNTDLGKSNVTGDGVSGEEDSGFTRVIAKESMMLPGMARDMNVMRQNIQKLVKLWSSKEDIDAAKGKPYAQGADEFFMREDQREAELEASRIVSKDKSTSPTPEKEEKEGGMLDGIMKMFSKGFMSAIKKIFNPKTLLKFLTKAGPIALIAGAIYSVFQGWKTVFETGSFKEGFIKAWGTMLELLTFGVFGEDTIRKLFDSISDFFSPVTDTISSIFTGIKDFFVKMFGGQVKVEDKTPAKMKGIQPSKPSGDGSKPSSGIEPLKTETPSTQTTPKPQPQTSSPTPVSSQTSEAKTVEKVDGEKIKLPAGVKYDPVTGGYEYNGRMFTASDQKEIETIKKAIDDKKIVEYQTTDDNLGRVTRIYNGATGESSFAPPKQTSPSPSPAPTSSGGGSVSAGGGSVSAGGGSVSAGGSSGGGSVSAGGSSGGDVGATPTAPSGAGVSETSSNVAEGQRMESAADAGSVINAPITNNNSGQTGQTPKKSSTVYDDDLAMVLTGA